MSTIHQITSPRTMQAFLVVAFGLVVCYLVIVGQEIPDLMAWSLAVIIGFYFKSDDKFPLNGNGKPPAGVPGGAPLTPAPVGALALVDPGSPIVRASVLAERVSKFVNDPFSDGLTKAERLRPV